VRKRFLVPLPHFHAEKNAHDRIIGHNSPLSAVLKVFLDVKVRKSQSGFSFLFFTSTSRKMPMT
jgi:hypothetical protein